MSSLIQIFLRPKYRSIKGFCELIVREWLIRGHPFCERFGQVLSDTSGNAAQEVRLIFPIIKHLCSFTSYFFLFYSHLFFFFFSTVFIN